MSRLEQIKDRLSDALSEQAWFQTLKAKYEELDAKKRLILKTSIAGSGLILLLGLGIQSSMRVSTLKAEINEKNDLLHLIEASNSELRKLKDEEIQQGRASDSAASGPWSAYLETVVTSAGIPRENFSLVSEKPGAKSDRSQESLLEIQIKKTNIKKATRIAFQLENGPRPLKLRNLTIDTKGDPSGYLDATLHLSGFSMKTEESN